MKRLILPVILMFLAAPAVFAGQAPAPRLSVKEARYDAGTVKRGTVVSHVFEITNAGTAPLVIEQVRPS